MEEKKAKEVKMQAVKNDKKQRLSYEQLNDACNQLFQQNQQLLKQLRELNATNMFKRLDYLFKVVELSAIFKDPDFINNCMDEIKEALTPMQEEDNKEE